MPTAFTPNGDSKNDILIPVLAGIAEFNYFKIYNRWGQQVFAARQAGSGWDGRLGGKLLPTGAFIFMVKGIDYLGNIIVRKGTVVLMR